MILNHHAGPRGFFLQVSGIFFGKVHSTEAVKPPVRAAKALCGTVWQLLYIRAHEDASFGLGVGVICVAEVTEHHIADIDNGDVV